MTAEKSTASNFIFSTYYTYNLAGLARALGVEIQTVIHATLFVHSVLCIDHREAHVSSIIEDIMKEQATKRHNSVSLMLYVGLKLWK
jgi:hypothetical protein